MTLYVQVRSTQQQDDGVVWVKEADADMFSVYVGEPGAFEWLADFANKDDAFGWAKQIANSRSAIFEDRVGEI